MHRRRRAILAAASLAVMALVACSAGGSADDDRRGSGRRPDAAAGVPHRRIAMSSTKPCGSTNLDRSMCMIELILADLRANYTWVDGGGIAGIEATSSTSFTVSLPQEERADLLTYSFEVGDGSVTMTGKTESAKSY